MSSPAGSSQFILHSAPSSDRLAQLAILRNELKEAHDAVLGAEKATVLLAGPDAPFSHLDLEAVLRELEESRNAIPRLEQRIRDLETEIAASLPAPLSPAPPPLSAVANGFALSSSLAADTPTSFASYDGRNGRAGSPGPESGILQSVSDTVMSLFVRLGPLGDAKVMERVRTMDELVDLVERHDQLKYELRLEEETLQSVMSCLSDSAGKDARAATYRLLRHLIVDASDVLLLNSHHLPLFLIRSLARDSAYELEKEHALRLIRTTLLHTSPNSYIPLSHRAPTELGVDVEPQEEREQVVPVAVMRAVVAVAEAVEEKLRLAALETLGELVITNLPLLVACDGLRVVLQCLSDGPHDLASYLSLGFLAAVDHPSERRWLRPGVDVEIILAGFTEVTGKSSMVEERVKASAGIVATFLKSWSGLFYLNIHGRQALVSLVDSLTNPSQAIRETLLDMLFSVFHVKNPSSSSRRTSKGIRNDDTASPISSRQAKNEPGLASLAADPKDPVTANKVSLLISEVLDLANSVLPPNHAVRVQALPKLFALTSSFDASDGRMAASSALLAVNSFDRNRRVGISDSKAESSRRNLQQRRQVESSKLRTALQMDDLDFRNLLLQTEVLSTKDETKWQFDRLLEIVEGPLRNPRRLEEVVRASKWMRRVVDFFRPFALRYSDLPKHALTNKWTTLGCALITTLLASPEGTAYLAEDRLVRQIAEALFQLDPTGSAGGVETVFSRDRIETTLASGYFEMLGVLSRSADGNKLLDQVRMFTAFYRVAELRDREDLVKLIVDNMDYSSDGHARVFLSKALTSSYKNIRLFATDHLATLLDVVSPASTTACTSRRPAAEEWQVGLIVQQLYDSASEVVQQAVKVLEKACENDETLEMVVRMRPALDLLGEVGVPLLIKFLSTSAGVRYLHEIDFIERELHDWFQERNLLYMVEVELVLALALQTEGDVYSATSLFDGTPPPHFYGELVKTDEGCDILRDSGHFDDFAAIISLHAESDFDQEFIETLKSVLWAVGHIGSSAAGLMLLDDFDVLADIVQIAAFSPIYSLRGTATYAIALISSTEEGAEMLDELGWESVSTPLCGPTGICVPMYLGDYLYTPLWSAPEPRLPTSLSLAPPSSHVEREILASLANLSNHILATKASKMLAKLKARHPPAFSSLAMAYRALQMLGGYHYRLTVRRYILDLFDVPLDNSSAARIAQAGEDLRRKKAAESAGERIGPSRPPSQPASATRTPSSAGSTSREPGLAFRPGSWTTSGAAAANILGAIAGDVTEDEDSSEDEAEAIIPVQVLSPIITVKGFLLA
ncbi:cytosolic regulator Pianissimo [Rhodotorula toruloides]|uniref:Cytosolic regulator Pianissimo n=1 Tax=Rhodotorula toruloides TaxID=5286 RepID=A0A511KIK7_RHOTO|nr:cytosolic regulator Pianissimo [Rhodotorula toruloides]